VRLEDTKLFRFEFTGTCSVGEIILVNKVMVCVSRLLGWDFRA